jgi:hypothetical protein
MCETCRAKSDRIAHDWPTLKGLGWQVTATHVYCPEHQRRELGTKRQRRAAHRRRAA